MAQLSTEYIKLKFHCHHTHFWMTSSCFFTWSNILSLWIWHENRSISLSLCTPKQSQLLGAEHKQLLEKNPKEQIWFLKNSSSFLRHYFNLSRFWHGFFAPLCRAFREEAVIRKAMCLAACTVFFLQPCQEHYFSPLNTVSWWCSVWSSETQALNEVTSHEVCFVPFEKAGQSCGIKKLKIFPLRLERTQWEHCFPLEQDWVAKGKV